MSNRRERLDALERKLRPRGSRWDVHAELRRLRGLTDADLVAELRALAAELEEPLSAKDEEMIEALQRLDPSAKHLPSPLAGPDGMTNSL